jgi:hypothetical protein
MSYTQQSDGQYHIPIVDLGERLRDNFGLTIREHEAFDPVDSVHAPNSYHYHGEAIDVQDWRDDNINGVSWQDRTKNLERLLQGSGAEILGPNSGVAGHDSHLHLAADGGIFKLNQQQYDTLFGGNAGGTSATFAGGTPPINTPASPQQQPERSEAKGKAQDYSKMSKAQLDSAYDAMRSDPAKAREEGMKMHKAYFGKK